MPSQTNTAAAIPDSEVPEQLFLDLPVDQVLDRDGSDLVEPWATMYVDAVREARFGDAIWARYHVFGAVGADGRYSDGRTVPEQIEGDAMGYKKYEAEIYAEAMEFYRGVSGLDGHPEVIDIIVRVDGMDLRRVKISEFK